MLKASSKTPSMWSASPGTRRYRSSGVHGLQGVNLGKIYNERKSSKKNEKIGTKDQEAYARMQQQQEAAKQAEGVVNTKPTEEPEAKPKSLMDLLAAQNHTSQNDKEGDDYNKKMSGHTGEGGSAGVEYEGGKPVAMKRGVKNNMFRLI